MKRQTIGQSISAGWLVILLAVPSYGQQSAVSADLVRLFQSTQTELTLSALNDVVGQCESVATSRTRSAGDRQYAQQLLSWAMNRRGEMLSEQAADEVNAGRIAEATALDTQAAEDFKRSLKLDPTRWRAKHNLAIAEAMKGNYDAAITLFGEVIQAVPNYANVYFNRGELLFEQQNYAAALQDYSVAIELAPQDAQYYNSRGHALFMLEKYDEAIGDYRRAVDLSPQQAAWHTDLADALQHRGDWESASLAYRNAIAADDQFGRAYQNAAWLMATCPNTKFQNRDLALSAAKKAIELDGLSDFRSLDTLAAAQAANRDFPAAQKTIRQAISIADPSIQAELQQRMALYAKGQAYIQPDPRVAVAVAQASGNTKVAPKLAPPARGQNGMTTQASPIGTGIRR